MVQQHEKILENKTSVTAACAGGGAHAVQLKNNREYSVVQRKLAEGTSTTQLASFMPVQRKVNHTGLPDNLKSGIENLSGHSMDDVKVHYNSAQPAQLNAHAYAQGTDIHIASGQEKHLPHEAWHVVQQKQGRVKPTLQMKGKVNVNDDSGLEKEADVMGAKALQMKSESGGINLGIKSYNSSNIIQNVLQRKVIINGVPKEPPAEVADGAEGVEDAPGYKSKNKGWITDDYNRTYLSTAEYEAHDKGEAVKCGLLETMGLWYRLPFPSAIPGDPPTKFFLIGETHGYSSIKLLLKASNQQNAKTLVESSAVFRNTKMGEGVEAAQNLDILADPDYPALHQIELGLAKALHAFASMRAPTKEKQKTATPATVKPYAASNKAAIEGKHTVINTDITLAEWQIEAAGKPKYRDANGLLYFQKDIQGKLTGIRRPKPADAKVYNQGKAMEDFLRKPEIVNALPPGVRDDYNAVVLSEEDKRNGDAYTARYTKAYNALRNASIINIKTVYPDLELKKKDTKDIVHRAAAAEMGNAVAQDGEVGMRHRNTVMLAGLKRAIAEGGYVVASLGAQHVEDIAAWKKDNALEIQIITYGDFVKNFSQEAE